MVPSLSVFGFSLSELIVVIVVALVVIGPKDLPKMLRKMGQYAGKLRRMASEGSTTGPLVFRQRSLPFYVGIFRRGIG